MKKKLPVISKPTPASAQRELAVKPVGGGSKPEFPTRKAMAKQVGLIGGALIATGGVASADMAKPAPPPPPQAQKQMPPDKAPAQNPAPAAEMGEGSVDGQPLAKKAPTFKVYRDGGGIGPAEDMWNMEEVEAFINWTMAKEGKLNLKTNYAFEYEGAKLQLDGYDEQRNVGYEYVDKLDWESREQYTKEVRAKLDKWMKEKKAAILFLEVKKNPDTATLKGKVLKFLAAVKKTPPAAGKLQ
jgi:hypothetical protein